MAYSLATTYAGESLISGFDWIDTADPSHGFVNYQSQEDAEAQHLYQVFPDTGVVRLGVDHVNKFELDEGRPSIRLESKESYNHGLFIADFLHMPPSVCGLWPAFWAYGEDWPNGGEIDIVEGANTAYNNLISAHTAEGCLHDAESQSGLYSGEQRSLDCAVGAFNIGCGYNPPSDVATTYGDGFNAAGGGVYAMEWDDDFIRVWHFSRENVPADIRADRPRPDSWDLPHAVFGGQGCDVNEFFSDMSLVININFCGDYGSAIWGSVDSCSDYAATCPEFVANNPQAFVNAYWDIKSIKVFNWDADATDESSDEPTTTVKMTSFSTLFVTVDPADPTPIVNPSRIEDSSHIGCFGSSTGFETFTEVQDSPDMTLDRCIQLCALSKYAGVFETTCYCADSIDAGTLAVASSSSCHCDRPCPGAPDQRCGGAGEASSEYLLTVYGAVLQDEKPVPPPMAIPSGGNRAPPIPPVIANKQAIVTITSCEDVLYQATSAAEAVAPVATASPPAAPAIPPTGVSIPTPQAQSPLPPAIIRLANTTTSAVPVVATAAATSMPRDSASIERTALFGLGVSLLALLL